MDAQNLTLPIAFVAGLLSFASPCVLPLVPAYLGYLGGTAVISREQPARPLLPFVHALLFVLGFTAVFVVLGASATFLGELLASYSLLLQRVGGVVLVVFGIRLMGVQTPTRGSGQAKRQGWLALAVVAGLVTLLLSGSDPLQRLEEGLLMAAVVLTGAGSALPIQIGLALAAGLLNFLSSYDTLIPNAIASLLIAAVVYLFGGTDLLYAEKRFEFKQGQPVGYLRSLLVGVIFAAGWTPCIGPILTGILVLASTLETVGHGILLLTVYSLGLGIPFLLVGLAFAPFSRALHKANRYLGVISIVSGALLALMGILIFTGSLGFLAQYGNFINLEL
jgi:cytochrome c-type biogenesis protein